MKHIKLDEKYCFSQDITSKIDALANKENKTKEEIKETLKALKLEYKTLNAQLKKDIKVDILNVKEKYKALQEDVKKEHQDSLKALQAQNVNDKRKFNELLSGINIKAKRASKNLIKDRLQDEIDCKAGIIELRSQYGKLRQHLLGKNSIWFAAVSEHIEEKNSTCLEKRLRDREYWLSKISIFSFLVLVIFYLLICSIGGATIEYERIIQDSSVIIAVALGGVFIYSMRSFDMSLGAGTAVAAAIGALIWNQTQSMFLVLIIGMVIGIVIELINSALASVLKLPVMVTTLAMASVLGAVLDNILDAFTTTDAIKVTGIRQFDTFGFYIGVLIAFFLITAFIFKFTPVGRRNKMIGANAVSSRYSGINITKQGLITFTIAGCAIGVGAMFYIVGARIVNKASCTTIGLDVILAIVFGGMQTTGGPKSKISAAVTGGLSATLITYILIALANLTGNTAFINYEALIKGILFLLIVVVNTIGNRSNRLPAIEMLW